MFSVALALLANMSWLLLLPLFVACFTLLEIQFSWQDHTTLCIMIDHLCMLTILFLFAVYAVATELFLFKSFKDIKLNHSQNNKSIFKILQHKT